MTLLLFGKRGEPIGRHEDATLDMEPPVVVWKSRVFIWETITSMGWHRYREVAPICFIGEDALRLAPTVPAKTE